MKDRNTKPLPDHLTARSFRKLHLRASYSGNGYELWG